MRALIDTCVIIDALQSRKDFCEDVQKIFLAAANNSYLGYISAKSATDIYYLTHHYTHSDKTSRDTLNKLFSIFGVLDTSGIDCRRAVPSPIADFEDAVMVETAARYEMDCIVTRNVKDFVGAAVKAVTPSEFLAKLLEE